MTTRALTSDAHPAEHDDPHWLLDLRSIRMIEKHWLEETPAGALMASAGAAVADVALRMWRAMSADTVVVVLVGPGNNGGDALVAGKLLLQAGLEVRAAVYPGLERTPPRAGDARRAWVAWRSASQGFHALDEVAGWVDEAPVLLIDGLFGIGLQRPLEPALAELADRLRGAQVPVLAIDVPSGLNADTGAAVSGGAVISACRTVTMIADKPGLHTGAGLLHAGEVWLAPLSVEPPQPPVRQPWAQLLDAPATAAMLPIIRVDSHKGEAGDVLVVGGRLGMAGAARLAARGALGVGAGRVWIGLDAEEALDGDSGTPADPVRPEIMQTFWPRSTSAADGGVAQALPGQQPVLVVGCGLGQDVQACNWLEHALATGAPLVLDADALSLIAAHPALLGAAAADESAAEEPAAARPQGAAIDPPDERQIALPMNAAGAEQPAAGEAPEGAENEAPQSAAPAAKAAPKFQTDDAAPSLGSEDSVEAPAEAPEVDAQTEVQTETQAATQTASAPDTLVQAADPAPAPDTSVQAADSGSDPAANDRLLPPADAAASTPKPERSPHPAPRRPARARNDDGRGTPPAVEARGKRSIRILTPHPLEAARLLNDSVARVQADRIKAARALARRFDAVVVLKGAGTVVAQPSGHYVINGSGHPVLGTAGSGDVLAGTIGALLARLLRAGVPAAEAGWRASCIGVWLHGRAGELLAGQRGPSGVPAAALADAYPAVWAELRHWDT